MKKLILKILVSIIFFGLFSLNVNAHIGERADRQNNHTAREEAEGKDIWTKVQAKEITCENLSKEDFGALGEYFMGQMMGTSHETMNNMMTQMMGEQGEEQMHVVMGKRLSGCDTRAVFPSQGVGFMPMMQMMGSVGMPMMGGTFTWGNTVSWFNLITYLLSWAFLILGIIALLKWINKK